MSFVSLEVWPMGLTKEKKMVAINTNIASLLAQNNTRQVNNELEKAMERLSSGLVNSAGDDAAGLAIAVIWKPRFVVFRQRLKMQMIVSQLYKLRRCYGRSRKHSTAYA